ncbi:E3 SUMO-protein ligase RanBP2 isoform X1 [Euwallacea fornicatus]|uniref:E3 SUMO-protein ligase RanBP2 isoform X1 n=1 Tax=Euwallacea fornicatus TaxID=995702 RepID=UPI00338F8489
MFRTRQEVDKHVNNTLKTLNNETERCLRGIAFAKLYFNVGDYEHAVRYANAYLSVKPKSPEGHNLVGKSLEKLGRKQTAIHAYRTSLQLNSKQNNLVLKVCELLTQDDLDIEISEAQYFCDLAQSLDPQNPIVSNLKEKIITSNSQDPNETSKFLLKELENRPTDVNLRVRLLKHLLETNKVKDAYKHASDIEQKKLDIFDDSIAWYETFAEVLVRYQKDCVATQLPWEFWFLSTSVLEKLAQLSLNEHVDNVKATPEYVTAVFNFDQSFLKASQSIDSCPDRRLLKEFQNHYEGQLNLHFSVLALKQAKKDLITFKEVENVILPLLFTAYNISIPDTKSYWFANLPEDRRLLLTGWQKAASFRCSQAGNILLGLAKDRRNIIIEKANQHSTGMWREQLFKKLFVKRDQQLRITTSYFISSSLEPIIQLPDYKDLISYNEIAQNVYPGSLHHYIWLALTYHNLSDFTLETFDGLQYSVKNMSNCAAETLSILDVQSFIYCAALCARSKIKNADQSLTYFTQNRPHVLPVSITNNLGTLNQSKFMTAAYKMYKNEYTSNMGEIRLIIIKGIEVIRCVGNHGLDVKLLVILAKIFADRVNKLKRPTQIEANSARAELYWKTALPLLEKLKNEHAVIYPNNRMFEFKNKDLTMDEIVSYIDQGKLFVGVQLMKKKEYEKAMQIFGELKDPYASFYQSQIYKSMAENKTLAPKEHLTSEMRSQNITFLSRARDCLYLTLDRLREPTQDKSHPLNAQLGTEIEKTERLLSRIDPDCTNRNECDGMSDENVSDDSVGEHYLSTYTHHASFQNPRDVNVTKHETSLLHSTPLRLSAPRREEARPSPERLDAQIRLLMASKDLALNNVLEQIKVMVLNVQQSLSDELRGFKDTIKGNSDDIRRMVDDLSHSVDDRLQSITDVVHEVRKELNELKKDQNKNANISVEDLYDLDPEYSSLDYNLGANLTSNAQPNLNNVASNLFQNYPRLPQLPFPASLAQYGAQALYPGLYPNLPFPYGALPQTAGLPFLPHAGDQQHLQQLPNLQAFPQMYPSVNNPHLNQLAGQIQNIPAPARESPKTSTFPSVAKESPKVSTLNNSGFGGFFGQGLTSSVSNPVGTPPTFLTQGVSNAVGGPSGFTSQAGVSSFVITPATSSRAPPVNVVITSSDPLPSFKSVTSSQPILSVTIPPQFIKGNLPKPGTSQGVHDYQIPMPTTNTVTPSVLSQPPPFVASQGLLSSVSSTAASPVDLGVKNLGTSPNVSLGIHIEKTLDKTFDTPKKPETSISFNKSSNSNTGIDEYDPRPDFQPIIPLPDEVPVTTGEEKEIELFCQRVKLFRYVTSEDAGEWKERGIGNIKILHNPETGKVRILMRREQVHKICANHFLTQDMALTPMANNDRALLWAANDFADEKVVLEKFCIRFKTAEEAKHFAEAFELAKTKIGVSTANVTPVKSVESTAEQNTPTNLGGFKFVTAPTFKPKEEPKPVVEVNEATKESEKPSPFAGFSFSSKTTETPVKNLFESLSEPAKFSPQIVPSQNNSTVTNPHKDDEPVEEFVPTQDFKPVLDKLPDLVEIKTGEENAEVLLEERSKLFRLDNSGEKSEWKERGIGNIKILKEDTIRLIMRRDQVHKVCLNHQILKNMSFKKATTDTKAVLWHAQDFSEGVLTPETFTARFKNEEIANNFLNTVQKLQTTLDENSQVSGKHHKPEVAQHKVGFADKFKLSKGNWECKNCYVFNDGKSSNCLACDSLKAGTSPKKAEPTFSFTAKPASDSSSTEVTITPLVSNWGNQFKPAAGTWTCQACYVSNSADKIKCVSCDTPKKGTASAGTKSISLDTGGLTFNFGVPAASPTNQQQPIQQPSVEPVADSTAVLSSFGDSFKPKPGSWECEICYVRNEPSSLYCLSCDAPKDDKVPKKELAQPKQVNLDTPGVKFSFGMPPVTSSVASATFAFGNSAKPTLAWKPAAETVKIEDNVKKNDNAVVSFGSAKTMDFEFKPRSPRKISTGQGEESDASYVEEEEPNVYFKPVVALPDIVEVKTGEENEEVLYSQRVKLYRYFTGEWKERGIGDIKILKDIVSGKLRVVMRREQVLKICLNHLLTKDVEYIPKDEKTWLFHAADFSEGELSHDQFCLRFKNGECAQIFKKKVDDALAAKKSIEEEETTTQNEHDSDVEFVSETQVTPEEEQEAIRLKLPPKFMAYRQKENCQCEQCKKDDECLKDLFGKETRNSTVPTVSVTNSTSSTFGTPMTSFGTSSSPGSVFDFLSVSNSTFGTVAGESPVIRPPKTEILKELLQKSSLSQPQSPDQKTSSLFTPKSGDLTSGSVSVSTPETTTSASAFGFGGSMQKFTSGVFSPVPENIFKTKSNNNSSLFNSSTPKEEANTSIFGSKPVFRSSTDAPKEGSNTSVFGSKSLFDTNTPKEGISTNIFGSKSWFGSGGETPKEGSVFGTKSLFGSNSDSVSNSPMGSSFNLFSINPSTAPSTQPGITSNIFSTVPNKSSNSSIFGSSLSAGNIFGSATTQPSASTNIFSTPSQAKIFGSGANSGNIFRQTIFGNKAEPKVTDANLTFGSTTTTNLKDTDEAVLQADSKLSFANLAKQTAATSDSPFTSKESTKSSFAFLDAGAPVFGNIKKDGKSLATKENLSKSQEGSENEGGEEESSEHDPHFEPIIPLPDQIVVSTGEEDETVLFNERAKLYRYDSQEWKERAVGQLKVLYHPENESYRLLLRREQVHKVALNQRITPDLDLQPMSTSDKAWLWAGMNYSDDEVKLERLAVKFKNAELAHAFKTCIEDVIPKVTKIQANRSHVSDFVPTTVQDAIENVSNDEDQTYEDDQYNEYDEDEEEEDDDDRSIMFSKRCTLSEQNGTDWQQLCMGELQVYYDPEQYTARVSFLSDSGVMISNTIIGVNTKMEQTNKECSWKAVEWAQGNNAFWHTLKATFSSVAAAEEFYSNYLEGLNFAQEVGAIDELPPQLDIEGDPVDDN